MTGKKRNLDLGARERQVYETVLRVGEGSRVKERILFLLALHKNRSPVTRRVTATILIATASAIFFAAFAFASNDSSTKTVTMKKAAVSTDSETKSTKPAESATPAVTLPPTDKKPRVLFIDGGHDYDHPAMDELLTWLSKSYTVDRAHLPADRGLLTPEAADRYVALIRYDQDQPTLSDAEMESLNALYERGIAVIALHHQIGAYSDRPDYWTTMGGYYVRDRNNTFTGKEVPVSSWIDDVPMKIHVEKPLHPITQGMSDFNVVDEAYDNVYVDERVDILLTTDEPKATHAVAWLWEKGNSPVLVFLLGHGPATFEHPDFRRILWNGLDFLIHDVRQRRESARLGSID